MYGDNVGSENRPIGKSDMEEALMWTCMSMDAHTHTHYMLWALSTGEGVAGWPEDDMHRHNNSFLQVSGLCKDPRFFTL